MPILNVPVTKAKATIEVDTDKLSEEVVAEIYALGLKVLINRGASKVTASNTPDEAERKASAMVIAQKQLEAVYAGTIKKAAKAKKASGKVMTEARRIAKQLVKDDLREKGFKISHFEASEITKAANALLDTDQGKDILAMAEANLAEQAKTPLAIDVSSLVKESPKLVAKAEKAKADKQLSAKQAGMTAKRKKGQGAGTQAQS